MLKNILPFFSLFIASAAIAQVPTFTKDINKQYQSGNPSALYVHNNVLYFSGVTEYEGAELWKSDGTAAGTMKVKDIWAGTGNSAPDRFAGVGNTVFFVATEGINGDELWKTDGTEQGTVLVKNINPGPATSDPELLTEASGKLFFIATDTTFGTELWVSDGTEAGTMVVKDINPGKMSSSPASLINFNGTLFFVANDDVNGIELWKTDGTEAGTVMVKNIGPGNKNSFINYPVVFNNRLYFTANDSAMGGELWSSDGTDTGTKIVADAITGTAGIGPADLVVSGNWIYFSASGASTGRELWKSDGTATGTNIVSDLDAGTSSSAPQNLVDVNGKLFFTADVDKGRELYVSDGTVAGTKLTRDLFTIQTDGLVSNLTAVGSTLFFSAHSNPDFQDIELYKSDGTGFGTSRIKNIAAGATASRPKFLVNLGGKLVFSANDQISGEELWISDGTTAGTILLKDVWSGTRGSNIISIAAYTGGVMFNANESVNGNELWKSNGDSANTKLVKDIASGASSNPRALTSAGDKVVFAANPNNFSTSEVDLYYSDGTNVSRTNTGANFVDYNDITYYLGSMFFSRNGFADGELYRYNFGGSGFRLKLLNPSGLGDYTHSYTIGSKYLYFVGDEGPHVGSRGNELWRTDGTASGTQMVKDIFPGETKDANPANLTALDSLLFFSATDGNDGAELWKTDGTTAGTVMVKDINSGGAGSNIQYMVAGNGKVFFVANDGTSGAELWVSDGTDAGTQMVKDLAPGAAGSNPTKLIFINNTLFFVLNDPATGEELWKSDGTDAGTVMVKDIYPGSTGSSISNMLKVRNLLFFSANDSVHGQELWKSDGTAAGTVMLPEVFAGLPSSNPDHFAMFGDTLFFTADHPSYGNELWFIYTSCLYAGLNAGTGCVGSDVQFSDASIDFGRTINDQWWDFGTGDTATGANVSYKYTTAGTYTVTHRIRSTDGCEHSNTRKVTVLDKPVAGFDINDTLQCQVGNSFAFQNTSTPATGATYLWKYSDGTSNSISNPSKSFTTPGSKTAKLVISIVGCKDSITKTMTVLPSPATSGITGKNVSSSTVDTFTVVNTPGSTYAWTVTGGTQIGGTNTNTVIVQWTNLSGTGSVKVVETNSQGCAGNLVSKNVVLQKPASVKDINGSRYMNIYPNPAVNNVSLNLESLPAGNYTATVINTLGQIMETQHVTAGRITEINVSELSTGVYTIRVSGQGGVFSQSIVINR